MVEFCEVSFAFESTAPLFRSLSWKLNEGEVFTVIGLGGSGKTTLLKLAAGLLPPQAGTVVRDPAARLAMTFQRGALFDSLTCGENLSLPLQRQGKKDVTTEVARALEAVGLSGIEGKATHELSGGMQKRLALARAWIQEPNLVLYDDPTAGLDPITSADIVDLLLTVQKRSHASAILATSDLAVAYRCSDRIGFLNDGIFVEIGTPTEIQNSLHPVVRQFVRGELEGPLTAKGELS